MPTGVRYKRSDRLNTSSELIIEHIPLVASSQQPFVHLAVVRYTLAMLSGAIIVGGSAMGWSIFHAFAAATIILAFPYSGPVVKVKPLCLVILVFSVRIQTHKALMPGWLYRIHCNRWRASSYLWT